MMLVFYVKEASLTEEHPGYCFPVMGSALIAGAK
jgi:hypothetical protein